MKKKGIKSVILLSLLIMVTLIAAYISIKSDIFAEKNITLTYSDNKISWLFNDDSNINGGYFTLYRDGKKIYKGDMPEYTDTSIKDTGKPENVQSINISYGLDAIIFDWDAPADRGSDNIYKVCYFNRYGIKTNKSDDSIYTYLSGISHYILNIGDIAFEADSQRLEVARSSIDSGVLEANLTALDKKGNESTPIKSGPIRNFGLSVLDKDGGLLIVNEDKQQEYTYKIYVNNEEILIEGNTIDTKDLFNAAVLPERPNARNLQGRINITASIGWDPIEASNELYVYYVEGTGASYSNKTYSRVFKRTNSLKGYYYRVNKEKDYKITNEDLFLDSKDTDNKIIIHDLEQKNTFNPFNLANFASIDANLDEEPYYFHIASVDSLFNVSETATCEFSIISTEKIKSMESFFIKSGNLEDLKYNIEVLALAVLPNNIINFIKKHKLKIYFTDDDLGYAYYNEPDDKIAGIYLGEDNTIHIKNKFYDSSVALHEVAHSIDYVAADYNSFSNRRDFVDIYNKEKDSLYSDKDYPRTDSSEYFAAAFVDYFHNPVTMKDLAPLTYEYMDRLVNRVK